MEAIVYLASSTNAVSSDSDRRLEEPYNKQDRKAFGACLWNLSAGKIIKGGLK